jgi:preprotein translocase SecE subunit
MADQAKNKSKRRVKNPETFRERAIKAADTAAKPSSAKRGRVKRAGGKLVRPVASPIKKVAGSKPLRPLVKVLKFIGKIIFPSYFRQSWRELKLVTWPTWKQSRQLTFAVLIFAVVFGAIISGVDYGLDKIFRNVLLK